jgi:hypothetical protein
MAVLQRLIDLADGPVLIHHDHMLARHNSGPIPRTRQANSDLSIVLVLGWAIKILSRPGVKIQIEDNVLVGHPPLTVTPLSGTLKNRDCGVYKPLSLLKRAS